jgi:hypothetical protein
MLHTPLYFPIGTEHRRSNVESVRQLVKWQEQGEEDEGEWLHGAVGERNTSTTKVQKKLTDDPKERAAKCQ